MAFNTRDVEGVDMHKSCAHKLPTNKENPAAKYNFAFMFMVNIDLLDFDDCKYKRILKFLMVFIYQIILLITKNEIFCDKSFRDLVVTSAIYGIFPMPNKK